MDRRRFYKWRARQAVGPTLRQQRDTELTMQIIAFHGASDGTYEAPRIHADLQDAGVAVSQKKVANSCGTAGSQGSVPIPGTRRPLSMGTARSPSLICSSGSSTRESAWFSDITYPHTGEGWAYLCVVRDGHTRRVLGRTVADSLHTDLVEDALRQAVAFRGYLPRKVVFYADRGTQYTSAQLAKAATELGVLRT